MSRVYDDRGRLITISDSKNKLVTYSYDDRDRVLAASLLSGKVSYSYDKGGRISKITDPNSSITLFKYDERGDLVEVEDAENGVTRYEYSDSHKLIRVIFPNRTEKAFSYDSLNRVSAA